MCSVIPFELEHFNRILPQSGLEHCLGLGVDSRVTYALVQYVTTLQLLGLLAPITSVMMTIEDNGRTASNK
jgi:hypothetical protein